MFSFTFQMDLSSLEGPPIEDSRFTCAGDIPRIRLDHVQSPIRSTRGLPPRPASTDMASLSRNKSPSATARGLWHSSSGERRRSLNQVSSHHREPSRHNATLASPAPRETSRPHSYGASSSQSQQLIWLESEQIWILTSTTTDTNDTITTSTPHRAPQALLAPAPRRGPGFPRPRSLSHSQSMEMYPMTSNGRRLVFEDDDLPPPYERHIYDRPLGPIPSAVNRVPALSVPTTSPAQGSRWAAIGQRIHPRPPF